VQIHKGVLIPVCVRAPVGLSYGNAASQQIAMRDQRSLQVGSPIQAIRGKNKTEFLSMCTACLVHVNAKSGYDCMWTMAKKICC